MMTNERRTAIAAWAAVVCAMAPSMAVAHDASPAAAGTHQGAEYRVAAGPMLASDNISVAGVSQHQACAGAGLQLFAGRSLAPRYRSGIELGFGFVAPLDRFELAGRALEQVAILSAAAHWMNAIALGGPFTLRLGLGPGLAHVFESSGAIAEHTAFGLSELVSLGVERELNESARVDVAVAGHFAQAITGSDDPDAIDRIHSEALLLTFGFSYGVAAPDGSKAGASR
jgi:hypothetical protein